MAEKINDKIEDVLQNERIKSIIMQAGHEDVEPIRRVSKLIGEVYTYCLVHNDSQPVDIDAIADYITTIKQAYFECRGDEKLLLEIRAKEIGKSIANKFGIDINQEISLEAAETIQNYFLENYIKNGYVFHSFSGACEESIRENGFSSNVRLWNNEEIMNVAALFQTKDILSPVGGYSHYSGGGMYVEHNPEQLYWHALSAPEWFKWFTSANHNGNSSKLNESPYYLRDYGACKQNVADLCANSNLTELETRMVMEMFQRNWDILGTKTMCVSLIPKSVIGKDKIEDAIIPGQSPIETIKTVLRDGRGQFTEHHGNVLTQTLTEKDMLIMRLPNASNFFRTPEFVHETRESLFNPKAVISMLARGTLESGFTLAQERIESVLNTLKIVHKDNSEVDNLINLYRQKAAETENIKRPQSIQEDFSGEER